MMSLKVQLIEAASTSKRMLALVEEEKELELDAFEFEQSGETGKDSIAVLLTRANSRTCLYSALSLRSLRSFYHKRDRSQTTDKEGHLAHKVDCAPAGCKVQPVCDSMVSNSTGEDTGNDASVNKKRRAISRMKELLKWAATAKFDKGGNKRWKVLYFRSKGVAKASCDDDISIDSSKISFSLDVDGCSAASSSFSPLSLASSSASHRTFSKRHSECITKEICDSPNAESVRAGNWITTDSEFVVLEL